MDLPLERDLRRDYAWRALPDLASILTWMVGKTVTHTAEDGDPPDCLMDCRRLHVAYASDGTALLIRTDSGWEGTEITTGRPQQVDYFALTPKP